MNKVVLVGNVHVGKTSLIERLRLNQFSYHSTSTIGAAFISHKVEFPDGESVNLNIWDTSGQDRYISIMPMYLRQATCVLLCFDRFDINSISQYIKTSLSYSGSHPTFFLVKTKKDLPDDTFVKADQFSKTEKIHLYSTSSKTGEGVFELFEAVAHVIKSSTSEIEEEKPILLTKRIKGTTCCE